MNKLKRIAMALFSCMFTLLAFAQPVTTQQAEPSDFMRSNGKIYVVVAVVVVIVVGLFIYLANLDRKITRLEKNNDKH
jgi:CcmD family protein